MEQVTQNRLFFRRIPTLIETQKTAEATVTAIIDDPSVIDFFTSAENLEADNWRFTHYGYVDAGRASSYLIFNRGEGEQLTITYSKGYLDIYSNSLLIKMLRDNKLKREDVPGFIIFTHK